MGIINKSVPSSEAQQIRKKVYDQRPFIVLFRRRSMPGHRDKLDKLDKLR